MSQNQYHVIEMGLSFSLVPLLFTFSLVETLFHVENDTEPVEMVFVRRISHPYQDNVTSAKLRGRCSENFDLSMQFQFSLDGGQVTMHLHQSNIKIPVYLIKHEIPIPINFEEDKETALYWGDNSSVSVQCKQPYKSNDDCLYFLSGIFSYNEVVFGIYPASEKAAAFGDADEKVKHIVHKVRLFDISDSSLHDAFIQKQLRRSNNGSRRKREKRAPTVYGIELAFFVDYSVYNFFYKLTIPEEQSSQKSKALSMLREYYWFLANTIKTVYSSLSRKDFILEVIYTGLFVSDSTLTSPWTTMGFTDNVNVFSVWKNFSYWVFNTQASGIGKYDHVMLFTRYNIQLGGTSVLGFSKIDSICTNQSVSILKEQFSLGTGLTAAHELGHSLGAKHDGLNNSCSGDTSNAMSSKLGASVSSTRTNPFVFSPCSYRYFAQTLHRLDSSKICLQNYSTKFDHSFHDRHTIKYTGQRLSASDQCQANFGLQSDLLKCMNISMFSADTFCTSMWCADGDICRSIMPLDGTSCGMKKWCLNGNCVYSKDALKIPFNCMFGDAFGAVVFIGMKKMTCREMGTLESNQCYMAETYRKCCWTCFHQQIEMPGCEFGDRSPHCTYLKCGMYDQVTRNVDCCWTCWGNLLKSIKKVASGSTAHTAIILMFKLKFPSKVAVLIMWICLYSLS